MARYTRAAIQTRDYPNLEESMFRWIREAFGHPRGGVHTRIATFCPKAPPPDPRPVEVEFTGREIAGPHPLWWELSDPERPTGMAPELGAPYGPDLERYEQQVGRIFDPARYNKDEARRTWGAVYADLERQAKQSDYAARAFERMAEEHDADRFDAASL